LVGSALCIWRARCNSALTGQWRRLKGCRQCGYAVFDRSKNRSAAWCAMSICGNRTKNRAYRRRRSSTTTNRDHDRRHGSPSASNSGHCCLEAEGVVEA
jgi:CGNR zinc finger